MSILAAIELSFIDDETEQKFLGKFTKALGYIPEIKGLVGLTAWKQVGAERTYMAFTEWESEQAVDEWLKGDREQSNIAASRDSLCSSTRSSRWQLVSRKSWKK